MGFSRSVRQAQARAFSAFTAALQALAAPRSGANPKRADPVPVSPTGAAPSYASLEIAASLRAYARRTKTGRAVADNAGFRVNLAKIESRPRLNRPWQYFFYLDFEGHCQDPECEAAIMGLLRRSLFVKLLGSYPAATTPKPETQMPPSHDPA